MLIERILRDPAGTVVPMGTATYHFRPRDEDGANVADVTDEAHIERFLDIPEGYREAAPLARAHRGLPPAKSDSPAAPPAPPAPPAPAPEPAPDGAQEGGDAAVSTDQTAAEPVDPEKIKGDELRALFLAELGRKASPKARDESLRRQIADARREKGLTAPQG